MHGRARSIITIAAGLTVAASCGDDEATRVADAAQSCDAAAAREAVARFGARLRDVSLLAADSVVARAIREAYGPLVTEDLLARWLAEPEDVPGREASSPWPDRIETRSVIAEGASCIVEGEIVYVTSVEVADGGASVREPVTLRLVQDSGLRISAFDAASSNPATVVRRYYAAIAARNYVVAYTFWGDDGAASGQTFDAFAAGFDRTASVEVDVGEAGRIEPAAGSRYIEIPVTVRAVTVAGEEQRFEGSYTLRRSVVDGASDAQRQWHLYSADIARVR
jgi:hypothetical protein